MSYKVKFYYLYIEIEVIRVNVKWGVISTIMAFIIILISGCIDINNDEKKAQPKISIYNSSSNVTNLSILIIDDNNGIIVHEDVKIINITGYYYIELDIPEGKYNVTINVNSNLTYSYDFLFENNRYPTQIFSIRDDKIIRIPNPVK